MNASILSDSLYKTGSENKEEEEEEIARRPESFGEAPEGAVEPQSPVCSFHRQHSELEKDSLLI